MTDQIAAETEVFDVSKEFSRTNFWQDMSINEFEEGAADDIPPVAPPVTWDYVTDVLVIGGGGSGLCAAAAALKNGAKVIVVEKQQRTGGHAQHSGAAASFFTKAAKRKRLKSDRAQAFKHALTVQSNATVEPRLLATLIDRSHEVFDWSESESWGENWDAMALGFIPDQGVARMLVKGMMSDAPFTSGTEAVAMMYPFMVWLEKHVREEKGGTILTGTKVKTLVKDGNRVVGIKALTAEGKIIYVKGEKAVILAGSGFSNNRAMIRKYCPYVFDRAVGTFTPPSDTGETVRMALGAGADLAGKDSWLAFSGGIDFRDTAYTGTPKPGPWFQYLRAGWVQLGRGNGWLEVNKGCEEFLPDAVKVDFDLNPKATAAQKGGAWVIFDSNFEKAIWETLPPPLLTDRPCRPNDPELPYYDKFKELAPKDYMVSVREAIEMGGIKVADTIPDLARQLGLDEAKLTRKVAEWNAKSKGKTADDYGRIPQNAKPIVKGPFYGFKTGPLIGGIFCGPRVNHRFEVLDTNRDPIPGLYAAGLNAGGTNGEEVMNPTVLSTVGLAFTTGWIAGSNATAPSTYEPANMNIKAAVKLQQLGDFVYKYFPWLGNLMMRKAK